jgi:L-asparaginase II
MIRRPEMVAGAGRFTTDLMTAGRGRWIAKEGAEGVYAVALSPDRRGRSTGIAFKIEDGSARARDAVTLAVMTRLSVLPDDARRALAVYAEPVLHNARGLDVGRVEADVPLVGKRRRSAAPSGRARAR